MKRIVTYLIAITIATLSMHSCIYEYFGTFVMEDCPKVKLTICMSGSSPASRALPTESGNVYENTIPGISYLQVYVFERDSDTYLGQISDLTLGGASNATERTLIGTMPKEWIGRNVRIVLMANYYNRASGPMFKIPASYADLSSSRFPFGPKKWTSDDASASKFIPMEGECAIADIQPSSVKAYNTGAIDLTRAVAKVRIKTAADSKFNVSSVRIFGAHDVVYSFAPSNYKVINKEKKGLDQILHYENIDLAPGQTYEFYMPEQAAGSATMTVFMAKPGAPAEMEGQTIEFRPYPTGTPYRIQRNHLYEFIITKQENSFADVFASVQDWIPVTVDTDFE